MSAAEKMSRRDEMETLLPFYVNGSLEGSELATVEEWLATDPAALSALGDAEAEFSGAAAANEAIRPPADALGRFARALDAETGPVRPAAGSSWLARTWQGFMAVPVGVAWAAAAALLVLVTAQAVLEPGGRSENFEIAGAESDLGKMPFALVKFRPDARIADIAPFLGENGLRIVSGPTADGVFRIAMPAANRADYDRLFGLIAAQPFAEAAVEGRKPADG